MEGWVGPSLELGEGVVDYVDCFMQVIKYLNFLILEFNIFENIFVNKFMSKIT
jgi:hypothetical protein